MALIETAEGQTLVVENRKSDRRPSLHAKGRLVIGGAGGKKFDVKLHKIYGRGAPSARFCDVERPKTRGDLTAEVMEDLANRVVGYAVARGWADRRAEVEIERLTVEERDAAKRADKAYVPDWEEDWPADGSASDKARYILENEPGYSDEEIAAVVGCSRSLVVDVKSGQG